MMVLSPLKSLNPLCSLAFVTTVTTRPAWQFVPFRRLSSAKMGSSWWTTAAASPARIVYKLALTTLVLSMKTHLLLTNAPSAHID